MLELKRNADGSLNTRSLSAHLRQSLIQVNTRNRRPLRPSGHFNVRDVAECPRSIGLRRLGVQPPPPDYDSLIRMQRGKEEEARVISMYHHLGLVSHSNLRLKRTLPSYGGIVLVGECDIILLNALLVEVKQTSEENYRKWKTWDDLPQGYKDQGNLYCFMFTLREGLFHIAVRGTSNFHILPFVPDDERNYYNLYRFADLEATLSVGGLPEPDHSEYYCAYKECWKYPVTEVDSGSGRTLSSDGGTSESPTI